MPLARAHNTPTGISSEVATSRQRLPTATVQRVMQRGQFWRIYMGILSWLIVGLVAGYIGSKLVNRTGEGLMRDLLLGVIGAIVGGAVFHALGYVGVMGVNLRSILVAAVGSVIVLVAYHAVTGQQAARSAWWR